MVEHAEHWVGPERGGDVDRKVLGGLTRSAEVGQGLHLG